MYYVNKIVWFFANPLTSGMCLLVASVIVSRCRFCRSRLLRRAILLVPLLWFWAWGCPWMTALIGLPLESRYLEDGKEVPAESYPVCDAIVILGGGMGHQPSLRYPNMNAAADRVWHAARLYKAGRAPKVLLSGTNELCASVPLLVDLGVPNDAILVDNESRNTYENARFTEKLLSGGGKKVLLVTSAWHMPRASGNFSKTSLECIPAACDFDATFSVRYTCSNGWWGFVLPAPDCFFLNSYLAKEWIGKLARK